MSHRYGDERIAAWLRENEYHPRSPKHGSASCLYLLDDLLYESEAFAEAAKDGELVYQEDYTVCEGPSRWNTDLVVGPPGGVGDIEVSPDDDRPIAEAEPQRIWLAIDAKSVMTEHGKARRNRQRDINSFADIMHRHHPGAVSGGLLLINTAKRFRSPLRDEGDITEHENIDRLVEQTIEIFSIDLTCKILLSDFRNSINAVSEVLKHFIVGQLSTPLSDVLPTETDITAVGHPLRRVRLDL